MIQATWPPLLLLVLSGILSIFVSMIFIVGSIILLLDANARYNDYKKLKLIVDKIQPNGRSFTARGMVKYMRTSWCARTAAIAAWPEYAKPYYKQMGYKWYHILPDGAPMCFFSYKWWLTAIGGK